MISLIFWAYYIYIHKPIRRSAHRHAKWSLCGTSGSSDRHRMRKRERERSWRETLRSRDALDCILVACGSTVGNRSGVTKLSANAGSERGVSCVRNNGRTVAPVAEKRRAKAIRGRQEETSWPSRTAVALRQSERMARDASRWSVLPGLLALIALAPIVAPFAAALSKNDLYQYEGPGSSALETDPNGMLMSAEAALKTPIAFYDKIYNSIFVSTDSWKLLSGMTFRMLVIFGGMIKNVVVMLNKNIGDIVSRMQYFNN